MIFSCLTLGCKTNQTETDALAAVLTAKGHIRTDWGRPAQALIINTCSVTAVSDRKSRGAVNKARREYPDAVIAVHGCMAQGMEAKPPNIDVLGGTGDRTGFVEEIERAVGLRGESAVSVPGGRNAVFRARTRAFLKIQDGCSNACAYCIIPGLRGGSRSTPFDEAARGAEAFAREGAREIVLTG
ncbi:MAG: tRNA (N(6)-L-threonylcarbamoyladenosine(37)-C(2))-methylthiotransferase MtaB, partial [Oscillospiraceae bacterium]|nr:tRNA (N(6)-L-threonylcarbamoyladenosine(37)-C(2))-methylthiotransferase MtaB [Oscillospiraceae bacterium]